MLKLADRADVVQIVRRDDRVAPVYLQLIRALIDLDETKSELRTTKRELASERADSETTRSQLRTHKENLQTISDSVQGMLSQAPKVLKGAFLEKRLEKLREDLRKPL